MDKEQHEKILRDFILGVNSESKGFILKGRTALFLCYNLDRFSTDIDLDSKNDLKSFVKKFCDKHNYNYFIKKDTDT